MTQGDLSQNNGARKGVCEEREQGTVDWCFQLCEWLETEYIDNGQTIYKNRILIHNLQRPITYYLQ